MLKYKIFLTVLTFFLLFVIYIKQKEIEEIEEMIEKENIIAIMKNDSGVLQYYENEKDVIKKSFNEWLPDAADWHYHNKHNSPYYEDGKLKHHYKVTIINKTILFNRWIQIILVSGIVLLAISLFYKRNISTLLYKAKTNILIKTNYFFVLSIFVLLIIKVFTFPSFIFYPEIIADGGINFVYWARHSAWWQAILKLDAGYLPLFPRILSLLIVHFTNIEYYNYFFQYSAIILSISCVSLINIDVFDKLIPNKYVRFFLGLSIGTYPSFDVHLFENFTIFFSILLLFIIISNIKEHENYLTFAEKRWADIIFYLIILFIVIPSKPYLMVFFPISFGLLVFAVKRKNKKQIVLWSVSTLGYLVQSYFMLQTRLEGKYWQGSGKIPTILSLFSEIYRNLSHVLLTFLYKENHYLFYMITVLAMLVTMFIFIYKSVKYKEYISLLFMFMFILLAFNSIILNILSMGEGLLKIDSIPDIIPSRHILSFYIFSCILIVQVLYYIFTNLQEIKTFIPIFFCLVLLGYNVYSSNDIHRYRENNFPQWNIYSSLIEQERYAIPISGTTFDNSRWLLMQGAMYLNCDDRYGAGCSDIQFIDSLGYILKWDSLKNYQQQKILAVIAEFPSDCIPNSPVHCYLVSKDAEQQKKVLKGRSLTPVNHAFQYIYIDEPCYKPDYIQLTDNCRNLIKCKRLYLLGW